MADIWVLTQPTEGGKRRGFVRADVITSVSGDGNRVRALRSDTQGVVSLAVGVTLGGRRKSLPSGFHVHFLQTLDEVQRDNSTRARAIMARWDMDQEEWQWVVEDVEDLAPRDF
ncbi:hypothetical protein [Streptomyces colonosanans]|uniref:hypothetical protein n=1 Tax=Streptomyces colonosanans TaxID=1428652 RepID=UPI00115FAE85|nr:hypothetical protein [Streptomyces colonosanans]